MTHLKLQIDGDGGSLNWVTIALPRKQFEELSDEQVVELHLLPALKQLVREARHTLSNIPIIVQR